MQDNANSVCPVAVRTECCENWPLWGCPTGNGVRSLRPILSSASGARPSVPLFLDLSTHRKRGGTGKPRYAYRCHR
jgi:hypothetical protein